MASRGNAQEAVLEVLPSVVDRPPCSALLAPDNVLPEAEGALLELVEVVHERRAVADTRRAIVVRTALAVKVLLLECALDLVPNARLLLVQPAKLGADARLDVAVERLLASRGRRGGGGRGGQRVGRQMRDESF